MTTKLFATELPLIHLLTVTSCVLSTKYPFIYTFLWYLFHFTDHRDTMLA